MRKKKTPEELAAEAEQEELDDFTSKYLCLYMVCIYKYFKKNIQENFSGI